MKSPLSKRIPGLVIKALLSLSAANAQIIYTDVNPDSVIANQSYDLDLNNDGIADFKINDSAWLVTTPCGWAKDYVIKITPLNNNAVLSDANAYPFALQANDPIASDLLSWLATPNQTLVQAQWYCSRSDGHIHPLIKGHWFNISDGKYAGLKLIKGQNTYYGWVRLTSGSSFTVKDYAFNSTPNMPILAGQKTYFTWVAMGSVTPLKNLYCPGDHLKIKYSALGAFKAANVFKVQLSDSVGSFANAVSIGSLKSTASGGTINAKLPPNTSPGAQYSIRVVSSDPSTDSLYGIRTGITIGAAITVGYGSTTFCAGNSVALITPSGYTYQWLKNGKKIEGETGNTLWVETSGNYSCIVKACGNDTSNTITITVNPLPKAVIIALGPTTFCTGGSVTLSDTVDSKGATYAWYGTNGINPIEGATKSSYTADTTGNYYVAVTTKKGCTATSPGVIVIAAVTPQGGIGRVGDLSFCIGDSTILVADNNNHEDNSFQYQWKKNGQNIADATNETYSVKTAGTYTCTMTNVCGSVTPPGVTLTTKQCLLSNSAANNEKIISSAIQLKIAPNPFSNSATISFTLTQSQKVSIRIFDRNGSLMKTLVNIEMQAGAHQLAWDAKDEKGNRVNTGIYLLRMQTGDYSETRKLVAEK